MRFTQNNMTEKTNIYQKLLLAQQEIGAITKSKDNPFFKSKYADINVILAEVKPILNKNGLVLTQALKNGFIATDNSSKLGIETRITDAESKEFISEFCEIQQGATPQQTGSAVTYYRRYALQSLLALEAQDDDANLASGKDDANLASGKEVKTGKDSEPVKKFMKDLTGEDNDI